MSTPREAVWAFALYGVMLAGLVIAARVPPLTIARRLVIELPFVAFAFLLPFVATGPSVEVAGMVVSSEGLWSAFNIVVKATVGATIAILLASTTEVASILRGLDRLHVPSPIVAIAGLMVRYMDIVVGDLRRARIARLSRAHQARWWWQARSLASTAGTQFIRSFERGERVYLAMLARGYVGALPEIKDDHANPRQWILALTLPILAAAISILAWMSA